MSRVLLLLFLLSTPLAWAQESDPVGAGSTGDESGAQTAPAGTGSTSDIPRPQSDSSPVQPAPTGEDPFDYESSEQISEDLSVSFPVDI